MSLPDSHEQPADERQDSGEALTTALEFVTVGTLSIFLFACWPAAALLPWAVLAGFLAWNRGGWGRS